MFKAVGKRIPNDPQPEQARRITIGRPLHGLASHAAFNADYWYVDRDPLTIADVPHGYVGDVNTMDIQQIFGELDCVRLANVPLTPTKTGHVDLPRLIAQAERARVKRIITGVTYLNEEHALAAFQHAGWEVRVRRFGPRGKFDGRNGPVRHACEYITARAPVQPQRPFSLPRLESCSA